MAERAGISKVTLAKIEKGEAGVSMAAYSSVLFCLGMIERLKDIADTDDHLRNHGFLYDNRGWRLSPVYDVNPTPRDIKAKILSTKIDFSNYSADTDIALSVCNEFSLPLAKAKEIIKNVGSVVSKEWRNTAKSFGIQKNEIDYMTSAFE